MSGVRDVDAYVQRLGAMTVQLHARAADICSKHAEITRATVVLDINTQSLGPGVRPSTDGTHIPSPPYGPPNADTGNLSARYTTTLRTSAGRIVAAVVAGVIYAAWLEFGTARMLPRPPLLPRFRGQTPKFRKEMREMHSELAKGVRGGK